MSTVAITDGQTLNIGEPDGPAMTFGVGRGPVVDQQPPADSTAPHRVQTSRRVPTAGAITIGRTSDNDVVVADVLASRHHAMLVPTNGGTEIRDAGTLNGTFVNGLRVEAAPLREGDVVTIGNIDLVFSGDTLAGRKQTDAATRTGGLQIQGATLTIDQGRTLLDNITFSARPGTLTAIIGPSGADKSTLAKLIAGATLPTQGRVSFEGHDIHAAYASLRSRIGLVPQDDVVHSRLTVDQALNYAAELRLPPDTTREDRRQIVARVLDELELTPHANTRVDKLSGGQRKRASVAMELLTGPSLLILNEPTSGLDPALDRQVMAMLRKLADAGRVVIVVTHSLAYLKVCDQVMLLAPGGKVAFGGSPADVGAMGTTDWADIFSEVAANRPARVVRHRGRNLRRVGDAGPRALRVRPLQRADHAASRGGDHGAAGAVRRCCGRRQGGAGSTVVDHPGALGHAAASSTVDLRVVEPNPGPQDAHWAHTPGAWIFDMAMLTVLCLVYGSFVRWKLRLKPA